MPLSEAFNEAERAAAAIIEHFDRRGDYRRADVERLCLMASSEESEEARAGLHGLFAALIERLNDSFEPAYCALHDQIVAQLVEFFRHRPSASRIDSLLSSFGLPDEPALLARKANLGREEAGFDRRKIRKAVFLSRVTLGADVAVTSVLIRALRDRLPQAEIVLVGSTKLGELFGGAEWLRVRGMKFDRGGGVEARLERWVETVEAVRAERAGFVDDQVWVIDPDSRLTQLGLLPVTPGDRGYSFFESRRYGATTRARLGELAAEWFGRLTGGPFETRPHPFLALPAELEVFGGGLASRLRAGVGAHLISVSLGVGGNSRKRLPESFETHFLLRLLRRSTLILDKGGTNEERQQIDALLDFFRSRGRTVVEVNAETASALIARERISADVLAWDGGIGAFAALVKASDEYIGYDSAGQHLAAALGTPLLTLFVNSNSQRFYDRWRPFGPGSSSVLLIDPEEISGGLQALNRLCGRALRLHRGLEREGS
jgi:hypothetical protein